MMHHTAKTHWSGNGTKQQSWQCQYCHIRWICTTYSILPHTNSPLWCIGTLAEDEDLGPEFTMESWPVAAWCEESLEMLFGTHDICPLPAYDNHNSLIPPSLYKIMLKGATVEVDFLYSHTFLKKKNRHYVSTSLCCMKILQALSAVPSSPFKCIKVSTASGKGNGHV